MANLKKDIKAESHSMWDKIRGGFYTVGKYASVALLTLGTAKYSKNFVKEDDVIKYPIENVERNMRAVDFQVDTLHYDKGTVAYFSTINNTITENYIIGKDNTYNQSRVNIAHEVKHRDNHFSGLARKPMSLEEYYKICCHNEISANIAELLQIRQEYSSNPTEENLSRLEKENPKFSFYFDALKDGTISINHSTVEDFDAEMRFIAISVKDKWIANSQYSYDKSHCNMVQVHLSINDYDDLKSNPENYEAYKKFVYNIGGINFDNYMPDITCENINIKLADNLVAQQAHRDDVYALLKPFNETLYENITEYSRAPSFFPMSLEQMAKLKYDEERASHINEILEVRSMWLNANSLEEREAIGDEFLDFNSRLYYYALVEGKIAPNGEVLTKEELEFINKIPVAIENYELDALAFYRLYKDIAKEDDYMYKLERSKIYTIEGIDYSNYIREANIEAYNPLIVMADGMIKDNCSEVSIIKLLKTEIDYEKDVIYIAKDINPKLSVKQQLEIARHQMFVQNIMYRSYIGSDEIFASNFDLDVRKFIKDLEENDDLLYNWREQECELASRIVKDNQSRLIKRGDNDRLYKEELKKVYNLNGINLLDYFDGDIDKAIPENFAHFDLAYYNMITLKDRFNFMIEDIKEEALNKITPKHTLKEVEDEDVYFGEPQYSSWSDSNRVSEVQKVWIYNFKSNILKNQRDLIALRSCCFEAKAAELMFDKRVNFRMYNDSVENTIEATSKDMPRDNYVMLQGRDR